MHASNSSCIYSSRAAATGVTSDNKASAAVLFLLMSSAAKVSHRSLDIAWTLLWRGSQYSCPCRSAFLLLIGESSALVAAVTCHA
jgi:hypothetical protein